MFFSLDKWPLITVSRAMSLAFRISERWDNGRFYAASKKNNNNSNNNIIMHDNNKNKTLFFNLFPSVDFSYFSNYGWY